MANNMQSTNSDIQVDAMGQDVILETKLRNVNAHLSSTDVANIHYVTHQLDNSISLGRRGGCLELFLRLRERNLLDEEMAAELLYSIGRSDLIKQLDIDKGEFLQRYKQRQPRFSPYSLMVVKICSELHTQQDIALFKKAAADHLRDRINAVQSALDIWVLLEEIQVVGPRKLHFLMEILDGIGREDLRQELQSYQETHQADNQRDSVSHRGNSCFMTSDPRANKFPDSVFGQHLPAAGGGNVNVFNMSNMNHVQIGSYNVINQYITPAPEPMVGVPGSNPSLAPFATHTHNTDPPPYSATFTSPPTLSPDLTPPPPTPLASENNTATMQLASWNEDDHSSGVTTSSTSSSGGHGTRVAPTLPSYKMDAKPRGFCIIISNEKFTSAPGSNGPSLDDRLGTERDIQNLSYIFLTTLKFKLQVYKNRTKTEIEEIIRWFAKDADHSNFDCFVCCILSHGQANAIYSSDGQLMNLRQFTAPFGATNCHSLVGKPKLFFIQACQGQSSQEAVSLSSSRRSTVSNPASVSTDCFHGDGSVFADDDGGGGTLQTDATVRLPQETIGNEADFLVGLATMPGYVSYRHKQDGSWYISKLTEMLHKYYESDDLLSILIKVNEEVARYGVARSRDTSGHYKMSPAPLASLRKKIFFR